MDLALQEATPPALAQALQSALQWLRSGDAHVDAVECQYLLRLAEACLGAGLTTGVELQEAVVALPQVGWIDGESHLLAVLSLAERQARQWQWPKALATVEHGLSQAPPSASSDVVLDLQRMRARALRELGHGDKALELLRALHASMLRDHAPDNPRALGVVEDLAAAHRELGNLPAARQLDEARLPEVRATFGTDSPEAARVEASLGQTLSLQGDDAEAARLLESAWLRLSLAMDHEHPQALAGRTALATVLWRLGRTSDALAHDLELARFHANVFGPNHPFARAALANLAQASADVGNDTELVDLLVQLVDACRQSFGPAHPATLRSRANLAQALIARGDPDQAADELRRATADADAALGPLHLDALRTLFRRGQALAAAGCVDAACAAATDLLQRLAAAVPTGDEWFSMADEALSFLVGDAARAFDWACMLRVSATLSMAMRDELSIRPVESSTQALQRYEHFHNAWARLALQRDPMHLPQALRALHAAPSVRLSLDDLGGASEDLAPWRRAVDAVHEARRRVRTCEAEVAEQGAESPEVDPGAGGDLRSASQPSVRHELALRIADERAAIDRLRQLRNVLALQRRERWAMRDSGDLTLDDLRKGLHGQSVAVVVFEDHEHGWALLVRPNGAAIVRLGGPLRCVLLSIEETGFGQGCLRGAEPFRHGIDDRGGAGAERTGAAPLLGAAAAIRDAFWKPLQEHLREADEVLIILGPGHYNLPIEAGNPGWRTGYFLGLPSYVARAMRPEALPAVRSVGVVGAAAMLSRRPIPFVDAEGEALRQLRYPTLDVHVLQAADLLRPIASADAVAALSVACHGGTTGASSGRFGRLVLEPDSEAGLSPSELSGWLGSVSEVYLSACVGGVSSTVAGGGPLGLVSEWQVRGCRAVVAFLAPIHDFYAPLLCAGYWHQRALGALPSEALRQAKSELLADRLPAVVGQALRKAYRAAIARLLEEVVEAATTPEHVNHAAVLLATLSGWPLPAAVRASYFSLNRGGGEQAQGCGLTADHRAFVDAMADPAERELLAVHVLGRLMPESGSVARAAECGKAIEHLCSMAVLFGR